MVSIIGVDKFKFLGVIIDDRMSWKPHILSISSTVAKNSGIMKRIRSKIDARATLLLYDTLILPHLNYCNIIWASSFRSQLCKIYRLQKKAIRLVFRANKLTHSAPLFHKLSCPSFYDLYNLQLASFVYIHTYQSDNDAFQSYFVANTAVHTHDTMSATKLHCIYARTQLCASSVRICSPVHWNLIPLDIQSLPSLKLFKKYMKLRLVSLYSLDTVKYL